VDVDVNKPRHDKQPSRVNPPRSARDADILCRSHRCDVSRICHDAGIVNTSAVDESGAVDDRSVKVILGHGDSGLSGVHVNAMLNS
jgi:hypothetical protein